MVPLDETDLALIQTLQMAPRVSWSDAGRVLDAAPATLSARWERITSDGVAWMTVHPSARTSQQTVIASVDIDCAPGTRKSVIAALRRDPRVVSIDECARGRDLLLTVMVDDLEALSELSLDELEFIPGVLRQRTSVVTATHRHGSDWRLDALTPDQRNAMSALASEAPRSTSPPPNAWPLIAALCQDARRSVAELARATGRTTATTHRHLRQLLASDVLSVRCEVAGAAVGWPVSCSWLAHVAPADQIRTVAALTSMPGLRLCMSTTGEWNLAFTVFCRSLHDMARIEQSLGTTAPWLSRLESVVHMRPVKRMGWLLGPDGRRTGELVVPSVLQAL